MRDVMTDSHKPKKDEPKAVTLTVSKPADFKNRKRTGITLAEYKELSITQDMHDEIANELEARQQELNDRLKMLTSDNKSFQVTASYLLDLAQRSAELFRTSDEALQQKLLEYVLSNIELNDKKLSYILNEPFKTIVETKKKALSGSNSNIWCE